MNGQMMVRARNEHFILVLVQLTILNVWAFLICNLQHRMEWYPSNKPRIFDTQKPAYAQQERRTWQKNPSLCAFQVSFGLLLAQRAWVRQLMSAKYFVSDFIEQEASAKCDCSIGDTGKTTSMPKESKSGSAGSISYNKKCVIKHRHEIKGRYIIELHQGPSRFTGGDSTVIAHANMPGTIWVIV